jgi:hypothetical protein
MPPWCGALAPLGGFGIAGIDLIGTVAKRIRGRTGGNAIGAIRTSHSQLILIYLNAGSHMSVQRRKMNRDEVEISLDNLARLGLVAASLAHFSHYSFWP